MTKKKSPRTDSPQVSGPPVPVEPRPLPTADTLRHYLRQVMRYPRLTREEEHELALRFRQHGDPEAAYRLVTGNLRLVVSIAFEYRRTFLNLMDLVQEGNIGLMQAVKKYDPLRGVPFSSYAAWWIRAYILKHLLDQWSIVKVGTTNARRKLFFNLRKEKARLEQEGVSVGPRLLAEAFETSEQDVVDVSRALSARDLSLDAPLGPDSDREVWETIPVQTPAPEEVVVQQELRDILRDKLAAFAITLNERERFTFEKRLVAEDPITLQQIGDHFGMTREAARLIEKKVIDKARAYLRAELSDLRAFEVTDDPDHKAESPAAAAYKMGKDPARTKRRAARRKKAAEEALARKEKS
ncbi:MAG: sigma-70 family RNA polymerase sigma factor [Candidatus Polarisedimenticolia bacterium]